MDSSSRWNPRWKGEVFISFNEEDTGRNFVSHLRAGFSNAGINSFSDPMLVMEEELEQELLGATEGSEIAIVVFSKRYASSTRCLDELVKINEVRITSGLVVVPVFYDVDPSDVRNRKVKFGKALKAHVSMLGLGEGMGRSVFSRWEDALTQVAKLDGWDVRSSRSEAEVVKEIVQHVLSKLGDISLSSESMSSSSQSKTHWIHDVFINFRGEDTREGFVSHLYAALSNAGVNTFLDDEKLHKGEELGPALSRAIQGSRVAIVIISKCYASSKWCLNELVEIMECYMTYGLVVVPVFYRVDPVDVRHQRREFGEALKAHRLDSGEGMKPSVLSRWRDALYHVANLSGYIVSSNQNEAKLVKYIVQYVLKELDNTSLSITQFPVGLKSRVKEVIEFINHQSYEICIVGIWGMGGSGKTTAAKVVYNKIHGTFVNKSFIENIREVCEKDSRYCIGLQKQLLSDVLNTKVKIHDIAMGTNKIEKGLSGKRTLLVLDDVSKFKQVTDLCGNHQGMGSGSVIIVTTRDLHLLKLLQANHIYEMKEMDINESLELFSWHAFKEASPREDLSKLSRSVVAYCGGLPLALEVLGSYLMERPKEEWEDVLSKLERIPNEEVQEKLKISYDGLNDEEKNIFLDICCFFIGKDRAYVTEILDDCKFYPKIGITVLKERSLIKIDKNNKLQMHDLLRDMGREIIRQSSPKEPGNRSRLWNNEEVLDVLTKHTGKKAIEGLTLKLERSTEIFFDAKAFKEMERLRLLKLNHVQLLGDYKYLPQHLRWVYWQGFPLKHMPDNFDQRNVVAVDLKYSNIKLVWKKPQLLERLKLLNLSHSRYLMHTPDFSKLPNLKKLILKDCPSLLELHQSIGDLSNLLVINLLDCTSISNLPRRIYQLKSLKTLILSGCSKINRLEEEIVQLESLTTLMAKDTAIKEMPHSIVRSKSIGYISLCGYEGFARDVFPSIIWSWMSPTKNPLSHIHPSWGLSSSLVSMKVQNNNNNLGDLAPMVRSLSKLRSVWVQCCSEVQLTQELRKILEYDVKFTLLETSSYASQVSNLSLRSLLIGMGCYHMVADTLSKSISQGLVMGLSADCVLPGNNYPYWLTHTGEGYSVYFKVPQVSYCRMKGMALCVVYSSALENEMAQCLVSILIVNYTKCIFQIYKQDTTISFNDEDWQGIMSNLGPGDKVGIFVVSGRRFTVKKTAVYLICD